MKIGEFFVPYIVTESANVRNRGHWAKQHRKDNELREAVGLMLTQYMPKHLIVTGPHPKRKVLITVRRAVALDWDNLVSGLKPFIDMLRCRKKRGHLIWNGIVWDDNPKYFDPSVKQVVIDDKETVGIRIKVEEA